MVKGKVYLEPAWKLHVGYHLRELVPYPPEGYQFVVNKDTAEGVFHRISQWGFSYRLMSEMFRLAPLNLIKSYLERFLKKAPEGTDLTFSLNHLIFRKEPWVIEIDAVWDPVGPNTRYVRKCKKVVERAFASEYCRKIFCACEFSRKTLLSLLDCSQFEQKVDILPRAVHSKEFTKKGNDGKVSLLFVGSANLSGAFEMRGGKEVLEAFAILRQKHKNLELVIRSDISPRLRGRYRECLVLPNLRLIDRVLPFSEFEQLYQSADIFLIPAHFADWLVILEAMSYELPIVTADVYAASEYVDDGKSGFLVRSSAGVPYFEDGIPLLNMTSRFQRAIQKVDPKVVTELVDKVSILIENGAMRRQMGKAGRWEIEHGKFSIEKRNEVLKRVFDEAIGGF
jgi:glycosyltransferase involved in cell wall biosynthesis